MSSRQQKEAKFNSDALSKFDETQLGVPLKLRWRGTFLDVQEDEPKHRLKRSASLSNPPSVCADEPFEKEKLYVERLNDANFASAPVARRIGRPFNKEGGGTPNAMGGHSVSATEGSRLSKVTFMSLPSSNAKFSRGANPPWRSNLGPMLLDNLSSGSECGWDEESHSDDGSPRKVASPGPSATSSDLAPPPGAAGSSLSKRSPSPRMPPGRSWKGREGDGKSQMRQLPPRELLSGQQSSEASTTPVQRSQSPIESGRPLKLERLPGDYSSGSSEMPSPLLTPPPAPTPERPCSPDRSTSPEVGVRPGAPGCGSGGQTPTRGGRVPHSPTRLPGLPEHQELNLETILETPADPQSHQQMPQQQVQGQNPQANQHFQPPQQPPPQQPPPQQRPPMQPPPQQPPPQQQQQQLLPQDSHLPPQHPQQQQQPPQQHQQYPSQGQVQPPPQSQQPQMQQHQQMPYDQGYPPQRQQQPPQQMGQHGQGPYYDMHQQHPPQQDMYGNQDGRRQDYSPPHMDMPRGQMHPQQSHQLNMHPQAPYQQSQYRHEYPPHPHQQGHPGDMLPMDYRQGPPPYGQPPSGGPPPDYQGRGPPGRMDNYGPPSGQGNVPHSELELAWLAARAARQDSQDDPHRRSQGLPPHGPSNQWYQQPQHRDMPPYPMKGGPYDYDDGHGGCGRPDMPGGPQDHPYYGRPGPGGYNQEVMHPGHRQHYDDGDQRMGQYREGPGGYPPPPDGYRGGPPPRGRYDYDEYQDPRNMPMQRHNGGGMPGGGPDPYGRQGGFGGQGPGPGPGQGMGPGGAGPPHGGYDMQPPPMHGRGGCQQRPMGNDLQMGGGDPRSGGGNQAGGRFDRGQGPMPSRQNQHYDGGHMGGAPPMDSQRGGMQPPRQQQQPPASAPPAATSAEGEGGAVAGQQGGLRFGEGQKWPNCGSVGHPEVCAEPCAFYVARSCLRGMECPYCHVLHAKRSMHLDKRNREALRSLQFMELLRLVQPTLEQKSVRLGLVDELMQIYRVLAPGIPVESLMLGTAAAADVTLAGGSNSALAKRYSSLKKALASMSFTELVTILSSNPEIDQTKKAEAKGVLKAMRMALSNTVESAPAPE